MARHVYRRPRVLADLLEIADYIARDNSTASLRFLDAAESCFRQLARTPELGAAAEFASPYLQGIRFWRVRGFGNFIAFYRPLEDGVEIIRVLHASRDAETLFGEAE